MGSNLCSSQAYYLRDQDAWTKIDYSAKADAWMKPLSRGKETGLVEIPANWCALCDVGQPVCGAHDNGAQVSGRSSAHDASELSTHARSVSKLYAGSSSLVRIRMDGCVVSAVRGR